jgi:hypothetical protein
MQQIFQTTLWLVSVPQLTYPPAIWAFPTALGIENTAARVRAWFGFASRLKWGPSHLDVVNRQCFFECICLDPVPKFRMRVKQTLSPLLFDAFNRAKGNTAPTAAILFGPRLVDFSHVSFLVNYLP